MNKHPNQIALEAEWQQLADAVAALGGAATTKEVAAHLGRPYSSIVTRMEGAWRHGLLDRQREGQRGRVYSTPARRPSQETP